MSRVSHSVQELISTNLRPFPLKKQKLISWFKWQATLPRHKLREESASSVQVGCIVWKNITGEGGGLGECVWGGNTGTGLAISKRERGKGRDWEGWPQLNHRRLGYRRTLASASSGGDHNHTVLLCWERYYAWWTTHLTMLASIKKMMQVVHV